MDYKINFATNINIKLDNCNLKSITFSFFKTLLPIFELYVSTILMSYFEELYQTKKLAKLLGVRSVSKKSATRTTQFKLFFGTINIPQIQIRVISLDGSQHQMSITRKLLGVSPKLQIPDFMKEIQAWISSVTTFRVGHSILNFLTGFTGSLTSMWKSVQWHAPRIKSGLNKNEGTNEFEADGTGISTKEGGKRGSEAKFLYQRLISGKLHFCGISIGKYKNKESWQEVLSPVLSKAIKIYDKIILASDADQTLINVAKSISKKILIQMDKWHVFHQLKYYLWQDGVSKNKRSKIIERFYKISMFLKSSIKKRNRKIKSYILLLDIVGFKHTATYLRTAMKYFYTHETEGNKNVYTSKTERSMRTSNQRINVGKWSEKGAENVLKIRLEYYYNGRSPLNWQK